ncbi:MAG: MBOAT family O-acyltransferase, partial [Pygmaiobacter sp.]
MQLNSAGFFLFFAAIFALYWLVPHRVRNPLLFLASLGFYCSFGGGYVFLLLACITVTFFGGRYLARHRTKAVVRTAVAAALAPLLLLKYFNFLALSFAGVFSVLALPFTPVLLALAQPVGISYYTFQMVSYLVDVYRGDTPPEENFCVCGLFLSFFPQIIQGPMTRPRLLAPQYHTERTFSYDRAIASAQSILLGIFEKKVVADNLAYYTAAVFKDAQQLHGGSLLLIAFFYTVQIYADFAGYTNMARGFAGLLGIELAENFKTPYLARSVKEFWNRWHISLSAWLRDYLYIPLGGNRTSTPRYLLNLFVTFLCSGLWHGASVMMLLWGALHGFYMVFGTLTKPLRDQMFARLHWKRESFSARVFSTAITFCLVGYAWIFFGAPTPAQGFYIASHLFYDFVPTLSYCKESIVLLGLSAEAFLRQMSLIGG